MAQQVKVHTMKHDNLSLIPETQMVAGANWLEHMYCGLCVFTHAPIPAQIK